MGNKWWGYLHTNGSVQVKPFFGDYQSLLDARDSPYSTRVFQPFPANSREEALAYINEQLTNKN